MILPCIPKENPACVQQVVRKLALRKTSLRVVRVEVIGVSIPMPELYVYNSQDQELDVQTKGHK